MVKVKGRWAGMAALLIAVAAYSESERPKPNCPFWQWSKKGRVVE